MNDPHEPTLNYVISEKRPYAVITLSGFIDDSTAHTINELAKEMSAKTEISAVVIQLAQVSHATGEGLRSFTLLQATVRNLPADIRLVGIPVGLKEYLLKMGVVRMLELQDALDTALLDLKRRNAKSGVDVAKRTSG